MSESRLINDIFCLIAEKLYQEPHSLEAKNALLDLCVTSQAMYQIAIPLVYREIKLRGNPYRTLLCFQTLLQNDLAASSVRTLRVHDLFSECHNESELFLGPSTLIPLFSGTLRRLNNLSSLYLRPILDSEEWRNELTELFNIRYPFSLRLLLIDLRSRFPAMINFINGQPALRELTFMYNLTTTDASLIHVATLKRVMLYADWTSCEAIATLLTHHSQITHFTLTVFSQTSERTLQSMVALVWENSRNLISFHLILSDSGKLPIAPANTGGSVWNSSLRLLKMSFSGAQGPVDVLFLPRVNAILRGKFPNLSATWLINCGPPPTSMLWPSAPEVKGPTWDFYCESKGEMCLARCEKGKENWVIEKLNEKDIPAVRDRLSRMG